MKAFELLTLKIFLKKMIFSFSCKENIYATKEKHIDVVLGDLRRHKVENIEDKTEKIQ